MLYDLSVATDVCCHRLIFLRMIGAGHCRPGVRPSALRASFSKASTMMGATLSATAELTAANSGLTNWNLILRSTWLHSSPVVVLRSRGRTVHRVTRLLKVPSCPPPEPPPLDLPGPGSRRPYFASVAGDRDETALPEMASTTPSSGTQKTRLLYVSESPPQPALRVPAVG